MSDFKPLPGPSGGKAFDRRLLVGGAAAALILAAGLGFGVARLTMPAPTAASAAAAGEQAEEGHQEGAESGHIDLNAAQAAALNIQILAVGQGGGSELILPGRVAVVPGAEAVVDAPLAGVVVAVHVGPGDPVRAGSALVTLRSADGAASRADVDAAQAAVQAARAAETRDRTLLEQGWVPQARLDITAAEARRAEAQLRAAQARMATYGSPGADGRVTVRSPIAGVVTRISVAPGQVLHEEALQVAGVSDARRVELVFEAPPQTASQLSIGTQLTATVPGSTPVSATVRAVAPVNEAGVVLVRARASSALPAAGTVVSARLTTGTQGGSLVVPVEAVQRLDGVPSVFVFDGEGFRAQAVVTGATAGGHVEIVSGLTGRERIAGRNAFLLKAELGRGEAEHAH